MKKSYLLVLVVFCLLISACSSGKKKEATTLDTFNVTAINNGYAVQDNMQNYTDLKYITGARLASFNDFNMEMVTYDSVNNATKAQESQIKSFMNLKSTGSVIEKDKGKNYYKYTMISNGYYMVSSRIDNTLIFSKVQLDNREQIDKVLKEINY